MHTNNADNAALLTKINEAVAAANEAEKTAEAAKAEVVSRSKAVGELLLEAKRRHPMRSFTEACCERFGDRLLALVGRSKAARTSNGRELVVVKDAAIKAF